MKFLFLFAALFTTPAQAGRNAGDDALRYFRETPPAGLKSESRESRIFGEAAAKPVDWSQPAIGCVEEMVPYRDRRPCPDFSGVKNPMQDWPEDMAAQEKKYWWSKRRAVTTCRSDEVLRREKKTPGSMNKAWVELSQMSIDALRNREAKIEAIYEASRTYGLPPAVLTGAVYQESLFAELGISDDGGNFSCGMQQINLTGWCNWMNKQSEGDKLAMGWPREEIPCGDQNLMPLSLFKPIVNIAQKRLGVGPSFRLSKKHFDNIPLESFVSQWPAASPDVHKQRYQMIRSFIENCSDPRKGIMAKGNELLTIYTKYIPEGLKANDRYGDDEHFKRKCQGDMGGSTYPLHTGWLLAVASYNGGPRAIDAVAHYNKWTLEDANNPEKVEGFQPFDLVESIFKGGKYNPTNDMIEFKALRDATVTKGWPWFKACVAQRHVARMIQHVTLTPDFFIESLEGNYACARSQFDASGKLVKTAVTPARQSASGVRP